MPGAGVMGAVRELLCLPFSRTMPATSPSTDSPGLCWEVAFQFFAPDKPSSAVDTAKKGHLKEHKC